MDDWMNDDEPFFDFGPVNDPFGEMIFDFSDGLDDDDLATMADEPLIASDPTAVPTTSKLHTLRYGLGAAFKRFVTNPHQKTSHIPQDIWDGLADLEDLYEK